MASVKSYSHQSFFTKGTLMPKVKLYKHFAGIFCATFAMVFTIPTYAQEFIIFEGKDSVREGDGGSKKVVNGMDFWVDGAPPKPFKLIGYITDRRHKTGLFGMISMSGLESSVVEVAKKNGGDAVIQVSSESETVGTAFNSTGTANVTSTGYGNTVKSSGFGTTNGFAAPVQKQQSKFAVVKYVVKPEAVNLNVIVSPPIESEKQKDVANPTQSEPVK